MDENPRTMIVRTSWLYGGFVEDRRQMTDDRKVFKNFVNTMLRVSETKIEVKVVSDQHGIPTSCVDLSYAISDLMDETLDQDEVGGIFHFSSACEYGGITWADFARSIFQSS